MLIKILLIRSHPLQTEKTDQYKDQESDIYYYKQRYYSQGLGRFISADPLYSEEVDKKGTDSQKMNLYVYANNNPLSFTDPNGTEGVGIGYGGALTVGSVRLDTSMTLRISKDSTKDFYDLSAYSIGLFKVNPNSSAIGDQNRDGYDTGVFGLHVDFGAEFKKNNSDNVSQMEGTTNAHGFSAGAGVDFAVDVTTSIKNGNGEVQRNYHDVPVSEISFGVGGGLGVEGHTNSESKSERIGGE